MRLDNDPTLDAVRGRGRVAPLLAALLSVGTLAAAQTRDRPLASSTQFVGATAGRQDLLVDPGVTKVWLDVRQAAASDGCVLSVQPSGQSLVAVTGASVVVPKTDMRSSDLFGGYSEVTTWAPPGPGVYALDSAEPYVGMMMVEGGATMKFWIEELGADRLLSPGRPSTLSVSMHDAAGQPLDGASVSALVEQTSNLDGSRPATPFRLQLPLMAGVEPGVYSATTTKELTQPGVYTFSIEGQQGLARRHLVTSLAVSDGATRRLVIPEAHPLSIVEMSDFEQAPQNAAAAGTVYYYSESNADFNKPVVVFVHGFSMTAGDTWFGSDGFTRAAGEANYRIAVVEVHPDKSFSTNAGILQSALPAIAAHYDVKKLVVVAHSKGGVDTDAAIVFGGMDAYVGSVITLGTPHWGTPMADLADGRWTWWLAEIFGSRNDGQASMKIGSMAAFRDQVARLPQVATDFRTIGGWKFWDDPLTYHAVSGLYLKQVGGGSGNGGNDGTVNYRDSIRPGGTEIFHGDPDAHTGVNHQGIRSRGKFWKHVQAQLLTVAYDNGPTAPADLAAVLEDAPAPGSVHLTWSRRSLHETGFRLERSVDGGPFTATDYAVPGGFEQMWDTQVQPGHNYSYRLRAHINDVWFSDASNVITIDFPLPIPAAPSQVSALTVSSSSIRITWVDNSVNEAGFEIQRRAAGSPGFSLAATVGANVTTLTHTGLQPGTVYDYRVRAVNGSHSSEFSNVATATTLQSAPAAPTGLVASALSSTSVRLNWTDNGNNETRFEVQRQQTPSGPSIENFSTVATLAANATTMTDAGLTPGSGYQYRVLAANAAGASAFSNIVAVTTAVTSPAAPSGLAASYNTTSRTYTLTWVDNSDNEDGFQVQAAYAGGAFADIAYVGVNATTHTSMPNPSIGSYQFRVRSFRPSLPSAYSSTAVLVVANPTPTTSILWIQPAESTFGMPGTLTAAGFAAGGSGAVQLVWRERSGAGVWGPWTTVSYQAPVQADTTWANTISSGSYTNQCHWFDAYTNYAGATSPVFHYTGVPGCS